jgi:hypothetical protein
VPVVAAPAESALTSSAIRSAVRYGFGSTALVGTEFWARVRTDRGARNYVHGADTIGMQILATAAQVEELAR